MELGGQLPVPKTDDELQHLYRVHKIHGVRMTHLGIGKATNTNWKGTPVFS